MSSKFHVFIQASRTNFTELKSIILNKILTIEANVCIHPKLAIFRENGKTEIVKMDFLHNRTTPLPLFINKNDFTHLINQHLNLHMLTFIFLTEK